MIRWLEGSIQHNHARAPVYAADTPLGRATVLPVRRKDRGIIAWRGKLADGLEIERATAQDCMVQLEQIIQLRLERDNTRRKTAWLD